MYSPSKCHDVKTEHETGCVHWRLGGRCIPGLEAGAEVGLLPRRKDNLAVDGVAVSKGEREGRRATDNLASGSVLGAVARANVLELGTVPRDNAAKVGACTEKNNAST